ncbi:hypothetical protein [Clostridium estertheticum]|uniref:hypothetical protein n=1 Tax=Clostridium estertheticum TaxID=238834 RepID=UPI001C0CB588|nr:hypothetical protein [Clostridium estertheticum]MBU3186504.1 hypothetical protein [Clostridium estertheticum]
MKYFILAISILYVWTIGKQLIHIFKIKTSKEVIDKLLVKVKTQTELDIITTSYVVLSIIPFLFILFSAIYVNTFLFAALCCVYAGWSIFDMVNLITYMQSYKVKNDAKQLSDKIYAQLMDSMKIDKDLQSKESEVASVSKTFNSKLYKLLSLPFDIAFVTFILYQLFLKW